MISVNVYREIGNFILDAQFSSEAEGIIALFGRSGSGKSTLINVLAGLLRPDRGRVEINERVLFDSNRSIHIPPEQRRLGYVFQESRLFPHYSVHHNLKYGMRRTLKAERHVKFDDVVGVLGIEQLLERKPRTLSGGERQRVALGRALLTSPNILLMDEPLASLDIARKQEVLPFMERLRDHFKIPIIYVSHDMDEIIRLADRLILIDNGKIIALGPIEELTKRLELHSLTGHYEAGTLLIGDITAHDEKFNLTEVKIAAGTFLLPRVESALGTQVRIRVRARDVSLAKTKPRDISQLNIFKGNITKINHDASNSNTPQIDVCVDIGISLWARVTRRALHDLDLHEGSEVYTLIKSTSIDRRTLGIHKAASTITME